MWAWGLLCLASPAHLWPNSSLALATLLPPPCLHSCPLRESQAQYLEESQPNTFWADLGTAGQGMSNRLAGLAQALSFLLW